MQDRDVVPGLLQPFEETGVLGLQFGVAQGQDLNLVGVRGHGALQLADLGCVFAAQLALCLLQPDTSARSSSGSSTATMG